tara:strand:- start:6252 stop:6575 length:324 start_codon:yes stop_codon:yes gene_type:complete
LFRYFDFDTDPEDYDPARGKLDLPTWHHAAIDELVTGLGWAVNIGSAAVMDGFSAWPAHWLLPPALRHYGCACCWSGMLAEGRSLHIARNEYRAPTCGVTSINCPCR